MSNKLLYKYNSFKALFEKLRRDRNRLWKAIKDENETELCDNFFDFCVTAHALRDWVIKENSCVLTENAVHNTCNSYEVLQMCRDIANANKHFGLNEDKERTKKTYSVFVSSSTMIDFYENLSNGSISRVMRDNLDIAIMNKNGVIYGIWEFAGKVEESWKEVFTKCGIKIS
jgi:hypothetical protein